MGHDKFPRTDLLPGTLDMLIRKTLTTGVLPGYGIAVPNRIRDR